MDATETNNKYLKMITPIRMVSNIWRDIREWKKKYITIIFTIYITILICWFEMGCLVLLLLVYYKYKSIIKIIHDLYKENEEVP